MFDAMLAAAISAAMVLVLAIAGNLLKIGKPSSGIDLVCMAVIVGCVSGGSDIGHEQGYGLLGILAGSAIGMVLAIAIRSRASRQ